MTSSFRPVLLAFDTPSDRRFCFRPQAIRLVHALAAIGIALACLHASGCATLVALSAVQNETVVVRTHPRTRRALVKSEPAGATIIKDGAPAGTTPTALDFDYLIEEREKRCWGLLPAGLVDMTAGGAGVWASYKGFGDDTSNPAFLVATGLSAAYAAFGLIGVLGPATGCYSETPEPLPVPRDYRLVLRKGDAEEPLVVRFSTDGIPADELSVGFRQLERADWLRAESSNTAEAYEEYLANYPRGAWRKEAGARRDGLAWQAASAQDTVLAYQAYVRKYPSGRWRSEAENRAEGMLWREAETRRTADAYWLCLRSYPQGNRAMAAEAAIVGLFESAPDQLSTGILSSLLQDQYSSIRQRALDELLRRNAVSEVHRVLSSGLASPLIRSHILDLLGQIVRNPGPPEREAVARKILCSFVASSPKAESPLPEDCEAAWKEESAQGRLFGRTGPSRLSFTQWHSTFRICGREHGELTCETFDSYAEAEAWRQERQTSVRQCQWEAQERAEQLAREASLRKMAERAAQCGGQ